MPLRQDGPKDEVLALAMHENVLLSVETELRKLMKKKGY